MTRMGDLRRNWKQSQDRVLSTKGPVPDCPCPRHALPKKCRSVKDPPRALPMNKNLAGSLCPYYHKEIFPVKTPPDVARGGAIGRR